MAKKKDFCLGKEDRSDLSENIDYILQHVFIIGKEWELIRRTQLTQFWVDTLGANLVDYFDSIADIYTCTEDECREPCNQDWDFCVGHGTGELKPC